MFDVFYLGTKPNLFPHEQAVDSIEQAQELSSTRYCWIVNYLTDYTKHDFLWEPVPWESNQTHVWPSQHQANGGTYLVPKTGGIDYNRNHATLPRKAGVPVVGIDHGDGLTVACDYSTRYISDYLGTLRRVLSKIKEEYVWVVSSVCDYSNFDFTWHPSEWQADMLHVFASNEQKFGDTFYVHVPSFIKKTENLALLEWFDTINFVDSPRVSRHMIPVVKHLHDSQVLSIWEHDFKTPVVQFSRYQSLDIEIPTINLWRQEVKSIVPLNQDASTVLVPREAKNFLKTQLYDYPVIDKTKKKMLPSQLQDIIFISYDEPDAEKNWNILQQKFPRAQRVHGVKGMELALEAAADISKTPWYFAVFAKTQLHEQFDFSFVPDYMQQPKHYIFNARNTVNGLEYGHMGVVMYNCKGVKQQNLQADFGIDYTLSFPHESIPLLSCYGSFDQTPYHTWRTAFRESAKLAYFESQHPTVDGSYRLNVWLTVAQGDYAEWSLRGAEDGVTFFQSTQGQLEVLKQSFRWEWLRSYFEQRYGDLK